MVISTSSGKIYEDKFEALLDRFSETFSQFTGPSERDVGRATRGMRIIKDEPMEPLPDLKQEMEQRRNMIPPRVPSNLLPSAQNFMGGGEKGYGGGDWPIGQVAEPQEFWKRSSDLSPRKPMSKYATDIKGHPAYRDVGTEMAIQTQKAEGTEAELLENVIKDKKFNEKAWDAWLESLPESVRMSDRRKEEGAGAVAKGVLRHLFSAPATFIEALRIFGFDTNDKSGLAEQLGIRQIGTEPELRAEFDPQQKYAMELKKPIIEGRLPRGESSGGAGSNKSPYESINNAKGRPNEEELLKQRERQIMYDRRLSYPNKEDRPPNAELHAIRERVKDLRGEGETIVGPALKTHTGKTFTGGNTHFEVYEKSYKEIDKIPKGHLKLQDGFVTSTGRFVDREEALQIAKQRDQIRGGRELRDTLDSFDLKNNPLMNRIEKDQIK